MPADSGQLLQAVRAALRRQGDRAAAVQMQRYMKSALPYHGVKLPRVRALARQLFAGLQLADAPDWRGAVLALWRGATHREERYVAIALTGDKRFDSHQTLAALPMYEEMIVTGAWWDFVDEIASRRLGPLLRRHPAKMKPLMRSWSRSGDLWKRRSAILCQLTFKTDTDRELLYACIEPSLGSTEFFLRKAIGWALRQYGRIDPEEVRRYVAAHERTLAGLSRREALKHVVG